MAHRLRAALLMVLILMPVVLVLQPVALARGQTQTGEYQQQFTNVLSVGYFNATAITISSPAIIGYATNSNVSIFTAFMDQQQLDSFSNPSAIANSIFAQVGTESYNALLEGAGTYYLIEYAENVSATITGLYIVNPNVDLSNSTTSYGRLVTIDPRQIFSVPLHIETLGSSFQVSIIGASTRIVQYSLLDRSTNTIVFQSPVVTITNFTVFPKVSVGYNLTLGSGLYVIAITDQSPDPAYIYLSYSLTPAFVNPYLFEMGPPSPTGIAAYGIYNNSGSITPYKVESSSIVGFADISTMQVTDNKSGSHQGSLQENTVLQVNNTDGSVYTYWPQNVLAFDTGASSVTYRNNVLNITGDGAELTNQSITGVGTTSVDNNNGAIQTYYGNYNSNYTYTYTLPQAWVLYTNETVEQGAGVLIQLGVRALDSSTPNKITWFDRITIVDPNVSTAAFVVDGRTYTPAGASSFNGMFYDAELVFGGGAGGQAATYQLSAKLAIFYLDQTLKPFPSLYTFGDDTAEAAFNIVVSNGNGVATAQDGTPYYGILTNDFNSSLASLVASTTSGSSGSSSIAYVTVAVLIAAVLVVAFLMVMRRRGAKSLVLQTQPMQAASRFCANCGTQIDPSVMFCPNCGTQQVLDTTVPPGGPPPQ